MEGLFYNCEDGYLEAILRGFKSGILTSTQYLNLTQCETLDDLKLQLAATDYGNFLQNEPSPLSTPSPKFFLSCLSGSEQLETICEGLATFLSCLSGSEHE